MTTTTITCPSPKCLMCQRERCMACAQPDDRPLLGCAHDRLERHTQLVRPLAGSICIDLADTEAAAEFLEMVARAVREKKRLRISIE